MNLPHEKPRPTHPIVASNHGPHSLRETLP